VAELKEESCVKGFQETCSLILAIGNYMNGGTNKGQAYGVKLNGFTKLVDCKKNGSKTETLLHQIVKSHCLKHPDSILFYSSWKKIWVAQDLSLRELEVELGKLETNLIGVKTELAEAEKLTVEKYREPLKKKLSNFLVKAEPIFQDNSDKFNEVKRFVTEVRQFFRHDPPESAEEDVVTHFLKTMTDFADQYRRCMNDVKKMNAPLPGSDQKDCFLCYKVKQTLSSAVLVEDFKHTAMEVLRERMKIQRHAVAPLEEGEEDSKG